MAARLDEILAGISAGNLVLTAEPGAGKTSGVPPALLGAGDGFNGSVLVSQPRRIAARFAARRVAQLVGCNVGETVGYQVRFDKKTSSATRLLFMTEGMLMQRLVGDPDLEGVDVVVLDEFHERHLDADLTLALLLDLQKRRPIRIVVMSATLDADRVSQHIGGTSVHVEGRVFPVDITYAPIRDRKPTSPRTSLARAVVRAVEDCADDAGHILVFLPGVGEIRACEEGCQGVAKRLGLTVAPLYGDLSPAAQDLAVYGERPDARRLILSTNVAETSLTIDGVRTVIDSGLHRKAVHDPWTGVGRLELAKIARASATQRAGRAGRTGPGKAIRLYSQADHDRRPEYDAPEIQRLDLAALTCRVQALGRSVEDLPWLDPPPDAARDSAAELLERLDLFGEDARDLALAAALPLHPRLARLAIEGARRGNRSRAAAVAALLSERPVRRIQRGAQAERDDIADLVVDLEVLRRPDGTTDRSAVSIVRTVAKDLERRLRRRVPESSDDGDPDELWRAVLLAFSDRLGALRLDRDKQRRLVFATGGSATLAPQSVVHGEWAVAVAAATRQQSSRAFTEVSSAVSIESDWILDELAHRIDEVVETQFDEARGVVEAVEELRLGSLVLERTARRGAVTPEVSARLAVEAHKLGWRAFSADPDFWEQRLVAAGHAGLGSLEFGEAQLEACLAQLCDGHRAFSQIRTLDFDVCAKATLRPQLDALARAAPERLRLPGGRNLLVHYETDRKPWVASYLQDFFGMLEAPRLPSGEPVVLHLRAPNKRDVQVTTDLAGFWDRHYPDLRKQLMRRYPKHDWPEDPRTAKPPAPRGRGRRRR